MKRLGIFCFYDKEGVVDKYVENLLEDLKLNITELIIVVNGNLEYEGKRILEGYSEKIILRQNEGLDFGAYTDVILNIIGEKNLKKWDEVVFCNDTFYGPFIPFQNIFLEMDSRESDFWGLNYVETNIINYIQSYFMVFRKKIIQNGVLYNFLVQNIGNKIESWEDACAFFEVGLFAYLLKYGYKFDVYANTHNYCINESADICIARYGLPILKKKTFDAAHFDLERQMQTLQYLVSQKINIAPILLNAKRLYGFNINYDAILKYEKKEVKGLRRKLPVARFTQNEFINYLQICEKVYMYGTGLYAKEIWYVYHQYFKKFGGFVVSDNQMIEADTLYGFPVKHYSSVKKDGVVIVALGLENTNAVKKNLGESNMLFLWKDNIDEFEREE